MAKINPFDFERPSVMQETKTFVDPSHPESPITLTVRAPELVDQHLILDTGQDLVFAYMGNPQEGIEPTTHFPAIGGRPVDISNSLLYSVASLLVLQVGEGMADLYSADQLIAMSVTFPSAFREISRWMSTLGKSRVGKDDDLGNSPAPTAPSS